ncbi:polysaccharide biosynthesis/export family protein [Sphingosinicella sp. LHD-64]|uniref:polysaccharide biosynthesis/export family protein n=1 Tax=Sphingosinicella sp. LHD-64 TaxID=3072139 RepID=UPI00280FA856|nr:polysaccharide biosynthesis/export family protein [Sphingosinicella sp. LHD-64]MDQ8755436.1 polysaccharide biosynthesis/export family protein [Sphingosinicella sp. LHD-64]
MRWLFLSLLGLLVAACASQDPFPVGTAGGQAQAGHRLAPGEKLRITTYGETALTGEYTIGAAGDVAFPLVGTIQAAGKTPQALGQELTAALANGFLLNPSVVVEVLTYRPIYVLGEVNQPGEFPYQPGMTALAAIARAEGFTYRARQASIFLKRAGEAEEREVTLTSDLTIQPGDIVRVAERYF